MNDRIALLSSTSAGGMARVFSSPFSHIALAPEGEGDAAAAAAAAPAPETVLFPDEKPADPAADPAKPAGDPGKPAAGDDWKEFTPDPAKTEAENTAAKVEHDKTKPAADPAPGDIVPADGKYTLTMPEGVELDQELSDALGPEFKELGLTNSQAQKLADKFIASQQERSAKMTEGWATTVQKWADDAKADKDIGGTKWDGTVSNARRAIDTLGTPALKDYLNATGGGNHPELIRLFAKVGGMIREDSPAHGGAGGSGKPADPAHILFPDDKPKGS